MRPKERSPEEIAELDALVAEQKAEMRRREDARGERSKGARSVGKNRSASLDLEFDEGGSFHDVLDDGTDGIEVEEITPAIERAQSPTRVHGRLWSKELIIEALRKWQEIYGEAPSTSDWNPSLARGRGRSDKVQRYVNGNWPGTATVMRHFGKWSEAIKAAGLRPLEPGPRDVSLIGSRIDRVSRRQLAQLRQRNGNSGGETARVGPAHLRAAVEIVAKTDEADEDALREALLKVAAVAVAWADRVGR